MTDLTSILQGTYNARSLPTRTAHSELSSDGGLIVRSDALSDLSPAGVQGLTDLGIGAIIDLRTESERGRAPDVLPHDEAIRFVPLPVLGGAMDELVRQLLPANGQHALDTDQIERIVEQVPTLAELYVAILESSARQFAELARVIVELADSPRPGVLFHCTAGKDRTGVGAALLLDAVGAERSAVVADYSSSQDHLSGAWADAMFEMVKQAGVPLTDTLRELIAETPASAIEQAFAWLDPQGGSAAYLQSGGLTDAELDSLTGRLTR